MSEVVIKPQNLFEADLNGYGKAIGKRAGQSPDSAGDGFQCWYPLGDLETGSELQIGLVLADRSEPVLREVEAHPTRQEWVYAIDEPVIQLVAHGAQAADPRTAQAIVLQPGEGLIIDAGVWHAPAFSLMQKKAYYGFVLAKPDPTVAEKGLIPLEGGKIIRVEL